MHVVARLVPATTHQKRFHPPFAAAFCPCVTGVIRNASSRLRFLRSTSKRKPWKVKLWPASGIERAS